MATTKIQCAKCHAIRPAQEFKTGYQKFGPFSRMYGQHPEHRYCPVCGRSIDWYGYRVVA